MQDKRRVAQNFVRDRFFDIAMGKEIVYSDEQYFNDLWLLYSRNRQERHRQGVY